MARDHPGKARNPNIEIRNKFEIPMTKTTMLTADSFVAFGAFEFRTLNLFRISDLELRIFFPTSVT